MIGTMARQAAIVAVLGLMLALASAGTAGAVTNTGTVYHSVTVQPDSIQTITVSCPPGFIAVSGGMVVGKLLFTGGAGPLLSVTRSAAGNGFTFRVGVPVTQSAQTIKLSVRCIRKGFKIPLKALNLKIGKTTSGALVVTPGATTNKKLMCPTGQAPTGAGFDAQPADGPRRAETVRGGTLAHYPTGAAAHLTTSMPVNGGWQFTLHNSGTRPVAFVLEVDCLQRTYVGHLGGRVAGRYETIFRQFSHNDLGGHSETTINARCARGAPLGSGFAFSPTLDLIPVTGPGRGRNQFIFDLLNGEMRLVPIMEYVLCRDERSYVG
jgi:hypothetical protein